MVQAEPSLDRWRRGLERIGHSSTEVEQRQEALLKHCADAGTSPDVLLAAAEAEFVAGVAPIAADEPLFVQSFLIHNGINVHGAIVCMPRNPEELREQGERFVALP